MNITGSFSKLLLLLEILTILQNLDCKNATQQGDIHIQTSIVRIIQEEKLGFSQILSQLFNFYIDNNAFGNRLKKLTLTLFTKKIPLLKEVITYQVTSYQFQPKLQNFVCSDFWCNANKFTVVFTSSRLTEMKFCPAYKLFINYILRLLVKRFTPATPARRDLSFARRDPAQPERNFPM